jgi:hypothetical protein
VVFKITESARFAILSEFNGADGETLIPPLFKLKMEIFSAQSPAGELLSGSTVYRLNSTGDLVDLYNFTGKSSVAGGPYPV